MGGHITTFFEKAKSLFPLYECAEVATEPAWEIYIANRLAAQNQFRGPKEKKLKAKREQDLTNDADDDTDDYGDHHEMCALELIRRFWKGKWIRVKEPYQRASDCCRVTRFSTNIRYVASFVTWTLIVNRRSLAWWPYYSPTRPVYIDVHFQHHCRSRYDSVEWHYTLGFKIYNRPGIKDYRPSESKKFENSRFDRAHSGNGWRSIAYGFYDDCGDYRKEWVRIENAKFVLGEDDVKDVYEALWGPLEKGWSIRCA